MRHLDHFIRCRREKGDHLGPPQLVEAPQPPRPLEKSNPTLLGQVDMIIGMPSPSAINQKVGYTDNVH